MAKIMRAKNQHFVPQFYFKLFSKGGTHIEAYILKRKESFPALIKNECSHDNFYSKKPMIEDALQKSDSKNSSIIRKIVEKRDLRAITSKDGLLTFITLQYSRTKSAKIFVNQFLENISQFSSDFNQYVTPWRNKEHLLSMHIRSPSAKLISDLIPILLINKTGINFTFSDTPIVFHNTYFNDKGDFGVTSICSPGLQIFCPLSNELCLMLYDKEYYSLKGITAVYTTLDITSEQDIAAINDLQFINCNEKVYYSNKNQKADIEDTHKRLFNSIGKRKSAMEVVGDIAHFYENNVRYDLKLSFLDLITNANANKRIRNEQLYENYKKALFNRCRNI